MLAGRRPLLGRPADLVGPVRRLAALVGLVALLAGAFLLLLLGQRLRHGFLHLLHLLHVLRDLLALALVAELAHLVAGFLQLLGGVAVLALLRRLLRLAEL